MARILLLASLAMVMSIALPGCGGQQVDEVDRAGQTYMQGGSLSERERELLEERIQEERMQEERQ